MSRARWLLRAAKAGHTGALDPMATGVLPICYGEATKFSQRMLESDKTYEARLRLGQETDTYDAEGSVTKVFSTDHLTQSMVKDALIPFRGEIIQAPPIFSALKHQGKPLYAYARAASKKHRKNEASESQHEPEKTLGSEERARSEQEIDQARLAELKNLRESKARRVVIHELEILDLDLDSCEPSLLLRVRCSKGTYIRSLAYDLGRALNCGAHLTALRRTQAGPFSLEQAVTIETLESLVGEDGEDFDERLLPVLSLLPDLPQVTLDANEEARFRSGLAADALLLPSFESLVSSIDTEAEIACLDASGTLVGLGLADRLVETSQDPSHDPDRRLIQVRPKRVVLKPSRD